MLNSKSIIAVTFALLAPVVLLAAYQALESAPPVQVDQRFFHAEPFHVAVSTDPSQPRSGNNKIRIEVRDAQKRLLGGARVSAVAEMPAMGSMPAMRAPAELAEVAPGVHAGGFELSMDGAWPLTVTIEHGGHRVRLVFDMTTSRAGLRLTSGPGVELAADGGGAIVVDPARRQAIGIRTGRVERRAFAVPLRLRGRIVYDETRLTDISLRFDGWIGELHADFEGKPVARGETLFTVYSPELLSLQEEYLQSQVRGGALESAARRRLKLWGLNERQIDWLGQQKAAQDYVPIFATASGTVIEKNIVSGSAYKKGERLLRLADLSRVWLEGFAYEQDLPLIKPGMRARVELPNRYGDEFEARVMQVDPFLQAQSRSARVRISLDNSEGEFQPGGFVDITLQAPLGERLLVPEDAVLIAGHRRFVFRDLGGGRLEPVAVRTGYSDGEHIVVRRGLSEGDHIITSGVFLIAAESRLQTGIEQW